VSGVDTSGYPFASMDTSSLMALQQMALQARGGTTPHLSQVCMPHHPSLPKRMRVASPAARCVGVRVATQTRHRTESVLLLIGRSLAVARGPLNSVCNECTRDVKKSTPAMCVRERDDGCDALRRSSRR